MARMRLMFLIGVGFLIASCAGYKESTLPDVRPSYDGAIDHCINAGHLIYATTIRRSMSFPK
jgi:hypothetical protein